MALTRVDRLDLVYAVDDLRIFRGPHDPGSKTTGTLDGFAPLGKGPQPGALQTSGEMFTIRASFMVGRKTLESGEPLACSVGPSDFAYVLYVNGRSLGEVGNLRGGNLISYTTTMFYIPLDLLNPNSIPNDIAIEIIAELADWQMDRLLVGGFDSISRTTFWRNFLGHNLVLGSAVLALVFSIFFLFMFKARKWSERAYLYFAAACVLYFISYLSMVFDSYAEAELLLETLSKMAFPLLLSMILILTLTITRVGCDLPWLRAVIFLFGLPASLLIAIQGNLDAMLDVFNVITAIYTPLLLFPGAAVLIVSLVRGRAGHVFAYVGGYFCILVCSAHDVYFSLSGGVKPFVWLTPYGCFAFLLFSIIILFMEQTELYTSSLRVASELREAHAKLEGVNRAYRKFVPLEFLTLLKKNDIIDVKLGDQISKELTVMFSDIRSFTTISEGMSAEETFHFLNSYLSCISPIIRRHNGFIDKYIGDGIMALFPATADSALEAAIGMRRELGEFNRNRFGQSVACLEIGIGINSGNLILGTIGESERMEGTVISDAVNLASRLESLTKLFGSPIIVSESTLAVTSGHYPSRFLGRVKVPGKRNPIDIHEIIDASDSGAGAVKLASMKAFNRAVKAFYDRDLEAARIEFGALVREFPEDSAAAYYLRRCAAAGAKDHWEGVEIVGMD